MPADPIEATRKKLNYKNKWSRQEVDESKQHRFAEPLAHDPCVAIIGGGLSGLACAQELAALNIRSVVFDTGKTSVGGRLATRTTADRSLRHQGAIMAFDHAAQFCTCSDPRFQSLIDTWMKKGSVRAWDKSVVGSLEAAGGVGSAAFTFTPMDESSPVPLIATRGMRALAQSMEQQLLVEHGKLVQVRRPCWVGKMAATASGWRLSGEGRDQGTYDALVIAHNGKCANRLVGPTGAPLVAKQLMGLRLSAVWAIMVAFKEPVRAASAFEGAFVHGNPVLSWVGNNSKKLGLEAGAPECWTFITTNAYGQKNKVPQEAVPDSVQQKVAGEALAAFAQVLGLPQGALPPVAFSRCQLWGAALPLNSPNVECILDPHSRVGVAGDWVMGSSMQAAAVSGIDLARRISKLRGVQGEELQGHAYGLRDPCHPLGVASTPIGDFPGMPATKQQTQQPQQQLQQQLQQLQPQPQGGGGGGRGGVGRGQGRGRGRQQQAEGEVRHRPVPQMIVR